MSIDQKRARRNGGIPPLTFGEDVSAASTCETSQAGKADFALTIPGLAA